jgi:thiosulfate dehydrogenase
MNPTEEQVQLRPHLVRWLLLLTAVVVLVLVVTQLLSPSAPPAPVAVEDEATQGPPPAGSYHCPATLAPGTAALPSTAGLAARFATGALGHGGEH